MAANLDKARERASEEAADWLILLQDDPDDPDLLRRFNAWLTENPANTSAWAVTDRVAGIIGRMSPSVADRWLPMLEAHRAGGLVVPSSPSLSSARRAVEVRLAERVWRHRLGFGLAAAAIVACLAFFVGRDAILYLRADYVTGTAEVRTISLTDGSTVVLAPDSALRITYRDGERRVDLLSGEAFFKVVHDVARPFRVAAGGVETTDLGTAFDVRRDDGGASIAVQQGSVRVDYPSAFPPVSEMLGARQTLWVAWTGAVIRGEELAGRIAPWRQGQIIAQDKPMREVLDRLRPYFAGAIIVTNSALGSRPVTGVYNLADPVEAVRGIAQAHGASVYRISPWILVISGG